MDLDGYLARLGGEWLVDVGLGDALYEPIRLTEGALEQGPFRHRLERPDAGWRFHHDPAGAFDVMDFEDAEAALGAFDRGHVALGRDAQAGQAAYEASREGPHVPA